MGNKKTLLCITLTLSMQFQHASSFDTAKYLTDFAKLYAKEWIPVITHETAHASILKILDKEQFNIHLGANGYEGATKLFGKKGLGNKYIKLHGIFPVGGYVNTGHKRKKNIKAKIKRIAMLLAGPIAGALTYYLINVAYNTIYPHSHYTSSFKRNWSEILKLSIYDTAIFYHLVQNLLPWRGSDGQKILEEIYPKFKKFLRTSEWNFVSLIIYLILSCQIHKNVARNLESYSKTIHKSFNIDKFNIDKFNREEAIRGGNLSLMILSNKIMGLITKFFSKGKIKYSDIDFEPLDIVRILQLSWSYRIAVQEKY